MRRINKHATGKIAFGNFAGGINVSVSGEQIAENEMQVCENFLYGVNNRKLLGRGGLSRPVYTFGSEVLSLFYDVDTNVTFVFLTNQTIYMLENDALQSIGRLTGDLPPSCCKFQDKLWIASGQKLQYYEFKGEISTVTNSPLCDLVFERFGRVVVTKTGSDNLYYSGVGDGAFWEENNNDDSAYKWLEVGYGDSGDIIAVVPLSTDLIVIKSNGKVYQVSGEYPSWQVYNVSNGTDAIGRMAATNLNNQVVFITRRGLKSLTTTMDYGNIALGDIGDKFNALLTKSLFEPTLFHLRRHSLLLIRPGADRKNFIAFNYQLGAATVIKFALPVASVVETREKILVAAGSNIYNWDEQYTQDDDQPILYKLQPKDTVSGERILLRSIDTRFVANTAGEAKITVNDKLAVTVPTNTRKKIRCNHSGEMMQLKLESDYAFELNHIILEVADL